jgi:hypothetical protein
MALEKVNRGCGEHRIIYDFHKEIWLKNISWSALPASNPKGYLDPMGEFAYNPRGLPVKAISKERMLTRLYERSSHIFIYWLDDLS